MLTQGYDNEVATFTSDEVCRFSGATFRQLDYWTRTDRIAPLPRPGESAGYARRWTMTDLLICAVFVRLRDARIELSKLDPIAHQLRADPTIDHIELQTHDAIGVTVNVALIRAQLEDLLAPC